ncbi:hypothetical protein AVEN_137150-1 [Araneus ventricosus]|uniref:Uncharacterized protein n=1 Tax=Araneus ventricosus TaxID=182803 RepID=A0A4Y2V150_ARAVE|nr:hypothetical protein AVEN_137150-1 [Araneus ventricosus]
MRRGRKFKFQGFFGLLTATSNPLASLSFSSDHWPRVGTLRVPLTVSEVATSTWGLFARRLRKVVCSFMTLDYIAALSLLVLKGLCGVLSCGNFSAREDLTK